MGVILLVAGGIADHLREKYMWSALKARKIFCSIGKLMKMKLFFFEISKNYIFKHFRCYSFVKKNIYIYKNGVKIKLANFENNKPIFVINLRYAIIEKQLIIIFRTYIRGIIFARCNIGYLENCYNCCTHRIRWPRWTRLERFFSQFTRYRSSGQSLLCYPYN